MSVTYRLLRGPARAPPDDRVAATFGRIPASRELASDHAQGKFTALLDAASSSSDEFRVARQPIQIIARPSAAVIR